MPPASQHRRQHGFDSVSTRSQQRPKKIVITRSASNRSDTGGPADAHEPCAVPSCHASAQCTSKANKGVRCGFRGIEAATIRDVG